MRIVVAAGLGLAAVLTGGAVILNNAGRAEPLAGPEVGGWPLQTAAASPPASEPRRQADPSSTEPAEVDAKAGNEAASGKPLEVLPPSREAKTGLPDSKERVPAITGKLPKSGSRQNGLVKGFPKDAVPVPNGARIVASSVASQGRILQVGLEAVSKESRERVLDLYEADFEDKGWLYAAAPALDGAQAIRGGFEGDSVTVTVSTAGTGATVLTVFAVLHAAG